MVGVEREECMNLGCEHRIICFLPGLKSNKKYKVVKVNNDINCPEGRSLKAVILEV